MEHENIYNMNGGCEVIYACCVFSPVSAYYLIVDLRRMTPAVQKLVNWCVFAALSFFTLDEVDDIFIDGHSFIQRLLGAAVYK